MTTQQLSLTSRPLPRLWPVWQGVEWSMHETLAVVVRHAGIIAVSMAMALLAGAGWMVLTPAQYTAQSLLQINLPPEKVMNIPDVVGQAGTDAAALRTQVDVIRSREVVTRALKQLNLPAGQGPAVVEDFLKHLHVTIVPRSYILQVGYTARDAQTAALAVNTLVETYLQNQMETRLETSRRAGVWMAERAKQLQQQLQASEMAVAEFRKQNNLEEAQGVPLTEQEMTTLTNQLVAAKLQLAEAEARAGSGNKITSKDVLNAPLVQNLRTQEAAARQNVAELSARYGARHPNMMAAMSELREIQAKLAEESANIHSSLAHEVNVAQTRVQLLSDQVAAAQTRQNLASGATIRLAELERQAATDRSLYEAFLTRSKQVAQLDFAQQETRVITRAEAPLEPSGPKALLVMLASLAVGAIAGMGLALLRDVLDSGFRTTAQLESLTGHKVLGMVGELPGANPAGLAGYAAAHPSSLFTESLRTLHTSLELAKGNAQVILVTSSVPQEGKSLCASSLAHVMAMQGQKVLLLDADLRRATQAPTLGLKPKAGLAEVLAGQATWKQATVKMPGSGLNVLAAWPTPQFSHELLASQRMKALVEELRGHYDIIVIDSPPVMVVADALRLAGLADAALYVVRWGETPRQVVMNGLKQMAGGVTGLVLSRVDLQRQKAYAAGDHAYCYGKYSNYYAN